ncbi:MAG: divergent polysaccharide deacetylase family protein [Alphaproteobacteria bacterium]|nr:MAG: divergent polysaccharide deacetylase family protein [Alphaproteobacteria bacterium]
MAVRNNRHRQKKGFGRKHSSSRKGWTWARIARAAKLLYAGVILAVLGGLVYVLHDRDEQVVAPEVAVSDPEVQAVLSDMSRKPIPPAKARPAPGNGTSVQDIEHLLPKPQKDPAWVQYAAHWVVSGDPKIAIVIDDLGLSGEATDRLAGMQGPYTLAFLPYAEDLPAQTRRVRAAGHELMVHMPMQPESTDADPGTNALLSGLTTAEFDRRLDWNLTRFEGFVGINNHMGSLLTAQPAPMVRVMVHLKKNGLLFLDSLTSPRSVAASAAHTAGVPTIARDVFLDNVRDEKPIMEQLAKTEEIARVRGWSVAIGHPYPETLEALTKWRKGLKRRHFVLVPLSQLVADLKAQEMHAANQPAKGEHRR